MNEAQWNTLRRKNKCVNTNFRFGTFNSNMRRLKNTWRQTLMRQANNQASLS